MMMVFLFSNFVLAFLNHKTQKNLKVLSFKTFGFLNSWNSNGFGGEEALKPFDAFGGLEM
jgi:hypothetical protein